MCGDPCASDGGGVQRGRSQAVERGGVQPGRTKGLHILASPLEPLTGRAQEVVGVHRRAPAQVVIDVRREQEDEDEPGEEDRPQPLAGGQPVQEEDAKTTPTTDELSNTADAIENAKPNHTDPEDEDETTEARD